MARTDYDSDLDRRVREFLLEKFSPSYGKRESYFGSNPLWKRMRDLGTEVWLDSGDMDEIGQLWTREFTGMTTNNSLLNKEIQKGTYDEYIVEASHVLDEFTDLTDHERKLEMAFILNARHGLRLVEEFDGFVSVEEHTELAHDVAGAVNYARRFHAVCPERFYVKIPFSAAGILATRQARLEGIPVNHTLGFSARQNYLATRIAHPSFVNVFMGRLNSFVNKNGLGAGDYVGPRTTIASQGYVRMLRRDHKIDTKQIGASLRNGQQIYDLAGLDVLTMPPEAAKEFLELGLDPGEITDRSSAEYEPAVNDDVDREAVGLNTLWDVPEDFRACVDQLQIEEPPETLTPDQLIDYLEGHGCSSVFMRWTDEQIEQSAEEGKIPKLENWRDLLAEGTVGLDTLMNLAGWNHFNDDQTKMDARVLDVLA